MEALTGVKMKGMKGKTVKAVMPVEEADVLRLPRGERPDGEWVRTHSTSRYAVWVRTGKDGAELAVLPTKRAFELAARYGVEPRWVGQCRFGLYLVYDAEEDGGKEGL